MIIYFSVTVVALAPSLPPSAVVATAVSTVTLIWTRGSDGTVVPFDKGCALSTGIDHYLIKLLT